MKPVLALGILLFLNQTSFAANQYHYELVRIQKIETKDFSKSSEKSAVFTKIDYPQCNTNGEPELDIGDYLLGSDCFFGEEAFIEVKPSEKGWKLYLPYCYSGHIYKFARTVKVFCKYQDFKG